MTEKMKFTDTSNRNLQQTLLCNQTLPIITMTMYPWIDDRVVTCGASLRKLATPSTTEVITDTLRSSVWVLRSPRHVIQTIRDGTTPLNCDISVSSTWANSPVLIVGIGVPPIRGHSGSLQVFNKRQSNVSENW